MVRILKQSGGGGTQGVPATWSERAPKLIKQAVLAARSEAKDLVEQAYRDSNAIRNAALEEARSIRETAVREGREAGRAEGTELVARLYAERAEVHRRAEASVLELAVAIAKKIIAGELHAAPQRIREIVHQAVKQVRDSGPLTIHVCPADLPLVEGDPRWGEISPLPVFQSDDTLSPGECIVETDFGFIDGRLETQLAAISRGLAARSENEDAAP